MENNQKIEAFLSSPKVDLSTSMNEKEKDELGKALLLALEGIRKDLGLTQKKFANIIHVGEGTYSSWKEKKKVSLSRNLTLNDLGILKFIDLYDAITSLYADPKGYKTWYNTPINPTFEKKSPLEAMRENPGAVLDLNRYVNWLINP